MKVTLATIVVDLIDEESCYLSSTRTAPSTAALIRKRYSTVLNKSHIIVTAKPRRRPSMNAPHRATCRGKGRQTYEKV
jgi:hypothetical protein